MVKMYTLFQTIVAQETYSSIYQIEVQFFIKEKLQFYTIQYYTASILIALEYLHKNGIVHRDLKPDNVMLDDNNKIILIDFGTAAIMNDNLISQNIQNQILKQRQNSGQFDLKKGSFVGTPEYVSPEMLNDWPTDQGVDIWALGCIIYKFFTGSSPFIDQTTYKIFERIKKLDYQMGNNIPESAQDLIQKLLVIDPQDRYIDDNYQKIKSHPFFKGIDFQNFDNNKVPFERKLIISGVQRKKCGPIFYKQRKLKVYDDLILEYFDNETNEKKGQIDLKNETKVQLGKREKWYVIIPNRKYKFKKFENEISPEQWVQKLQSLINDQKE